MISPASPEAYDLLHQGSIALAQVEAAGMRIDTDYLDRTVKETNTEIKETEKKLMAGRVWREWRKRFGSKAEFDSDYQLGIILYDVLGTPNPVHAPSSTKERPRYSTDEAVLEKIDQKFVKEYLKLKKLKKVVNTYLNGLIKHVEGGYIHGSFNLNRVVTYRSSMSDPNLQNVPIRDPIQGKIIRQAYIPRDDHQLVEIDIGGAEVRVAACYHKDPTMLRYIRDGYDLHKDMAIECYRLPKMKDYGEGTKHLKAARQQAKALFVFAEFYGDYWRGVAPSMWDAIGRYHLKAPDGSGIYDWLATQGITRLGNLNPKEKPESDSFAKHIKDVEENFWGKRFPVYAKWKEDWLAQYKRRGWIKMHTGFVVQGVYKKNEIINSPIQGSSFHWLLWSVIQMVRELRKRKMRSRVVCQIHDSMVADVHKDELDDYLALAKDIMTVRAPVAWPWLVTELEVEAKISELGGNWHKLTERKL